MKLLQDFTFQLEHGSAVCTAVSGAISEVLSEAFGNAKKASEALGGARKDVDEGEKIIGKIRKRFRRSRRRSLPPRHPVGIRSAVAGMFCHGRRCPRQPQVQVDHVPAQRHEEFCEVRPKRSETAPIRSPTWHQVKMDVSLPKKRKQNICDFFSRRNVRKCEAKIALCGWI